MRKIFLAGALALIVLPGLIHAQNAGFLGRHFTATYHLHAMPRLDIYYAEYMVPQKRVDFRHELQASAIVGRFTMLHGIYQTASYDALRYFKYDREGEIDFKMNAFGAGISLYNKFGPSPLAPVGNYFKMQALVVKFRLTDEQGLYNFDEWSMPDTVSPSRREALGTSVRFGLGFGRTRVIKERIIIDYGLESDIGLLNSVEEQDPDNPYYPYGGVSQALNFGLRPLGISLRLGVGGLLF